MTEAQSAKNSLFDYASPISWNAVTAGTDSVGQGTWVRYYANTMLYGGCFYNSSFQGDCRCWMLRVQAPDGLQVEAVFDASVSGRPMVSVIEDVQPMWGGEEGSRSW